MKAFRTMSPFLKRYKWSYFFGVLFLIMVDTASLLIPQVIKQFTDRIQFNTLTIELAIRYALAMVVLGVFISVGRFVWRTLLFGVSRKAEYYLRDKLFLHLETLDANFYNHNKTGDIMAHATNDVQTVRMSLGAGIMMVIDSMFMTVLTVVMMIITVGIGATLVALLALPIISVIVWVFSPRFHERSRRVQNTFSEMTDLVQESLSGIRVIKTFAIEEVQEREFEGVNHKYMRKNLELIRLSGMFDPLIQAIASVSFVVFLIYGVRQVFVGNMTLGGFLAVINYLSMILWPLIALGMVVNMFQRGIASMERLNGIYSQKSAMVETSSPVAMENPKGNIRFERVSFRYGPDQPDVLKEIDLTVENGQSLAILGRTGSGKTTLVNLLLRLYDVTEGAITFDGHDLRDLSFNDLRSNIGYAPQDNFLFSKDIKTNIAFGRSDEVPFEEIREAAAFADIDEDILAFPKGYDTVVGERGVTLSGGQKQRVSIARAYLKRAPLLIFDDSLSAVDTETESNILSHLGQISDQNLILISQRISTIKHADHIVVLEDGRIVQRGDHDSLLEEEGLYKSLYERQQLEDRLSQGGDYESQ